MRNFESRIRKQYKKTPAAEKKELLKAINKHLENHRARAHCEKVRDVAVAIAEALNGKKIEVDVDALEVASLGHDAFREQNNHEKVAHDFFHERGRSDIAKMVAATDFPMSKQFPAGRTEFRLEDHILKYADAIVEHDKITDWNTRVKGIEEKYRSAKRLDYVAKQNFKEHRESLKEFEAWIASKGVNIKKLLTELS